VPAERFLVRLGPAIDLHVETVDGDELALAWVGFKQDVIASRITMTQHELRDAAQTLEAIACKLTNQQS
jgi:hypothetical protein